MQLHIHRYECSYVSHVLWLIHCQTFGSPVYPHEGTQGTNARHEWEAASLHTDDPQYSPARFGGDESFSCIYSEQDGPTGDGIHIGNRHSPQEPNYNHGTRNGGIQFPPGFDEARQLHHVIMELQALSGHTPETPMRLDKVDREEHPHWSVPHPPGIEGGQVMVPIPAELLPMEPDSVGTQSPSKRRREPTPDQKGPEEREGIEHSQKKPRNFEIQEYIPVGAPEVGVLRSKW